MHLLESRIVLHCLYCIVYKRMSFNNKSYWASQKSDTKSLKCGFTHQLVRLGVGDISKKIIESRYIGICQIIDKIIDIGRILPQIIGDFRDLSAKLSISKMTGKLSKIYRYRKK